ncbi:hypothetical protein BHYA_0195g00040 [Botrytis hyacinthi]|uniref:Uncharacterized protein n=1 Tax=Botrytis hyacinthi TaxID=278943 RepID=A0A4Z1GC01_9HELO|nr:hypothetical protein BHYA_0195g00040 [Botrytis hyacinthi]
MQYVIKPPLTNSAAADRNPSIRISHSYLEVDTRMRQAYQTETSVSFETAQRSKVETKESITHEILQNLGTTLLEEMNRRPGHETLGLKSHDFGTKSVHNDDAHVGEA